MATYSVIAQELIEDFPEVVTVTPAPYDLTQPPELQMMLTYQKLQRSSRRQDRITTLVYAYYLGELLENNINRSQRRYFLSQTTTYFSRTAQRIYNLFEKTGVEQIYRTKFITFAKISRLSAHAYNLLISS